MDPTPVLSTLPAAHDLSPWGLFLQADPVVKAVMLLLALASIACWTVIVEKLATLRRLRREARELGAMAADGQVPATLPDRGDLASAALRAGVPEWRADQGRNETDGEYRARLEGAMRKGVGRALKPAGAGLQLLATTGSVAPFVGLFGTVWGIMNSFIGIAQTQTTNLAVVAPGIAEALLATAIGLFAAIPAVVIYNVFARMIASYKASLGDVAAQIMLLQSRDLDLNASGSQPLRPAQKLRVG